MNNSPIKITATEKSRAKQVALILLIGINLIVALYMMGVMINVYIGVVSDDLGVQRALLSLNNTMRYIIAFVMNLVINILLRKIGLKKIILFGLISGVLSLILFSAANSLPMFYISGAIGGMSTCFAGIVPVSLLIRYCFPKSQGTVLAVTSSMTGVAGITIAPLISAVVKTSNWRMGFCVLAIIAAVIFALEFFFLKVPEEIRDAENITEKNARKKDVISDKNSSNTGKFIRMILISTLSAIGVLCLYSNAAVVLHEIGFSLVFVTGTAVSLISVFNILGKFVVGRLCDTKDARKVMIGWYALCVVCSVYFIIDRIPNLGLALPGLITLGIIGGIYSVPIPFIGARLFHNVDEYTKVIGYCTAASNLGSAISGILFHGVYDWTGSYMCSLLYVTILSAINVVIVASLIGKKR